MNLCPMAGSAMHEETVMRLYRPPHSRMYPPPHNLCPMVGSAMPEEAVMRFYS
jgi:hypothetical protein